MVENWPAVTDSEKDVQSLNDFLLIKEVITKIRNIRTENKIQPAQKINVLINSEKNIDLIKSQQKVISRLARIETWRCPLKA